MSSTNFRFGGCMWCHPGGGALEYDRDGYRYDATAFANPNRAADGGPVSVIDSLGNILSTNPAGIRYGDYWVFDAASDGLVSKAGATGKGVTEVDCLMCHLDAPYNNQARDFCSSKPGALGFAPKLGPSMGLTLTGEVSTTEPGSLAGGNPSCDILGYADGLIEFNMITAVPRKEGCSLCHFPDNAKPKGVGPASAPLDWTTFQKYIPPGDFTDSDIVDSTVAGTTTNVLPYNIAKGRAEMGKRGFAINDAGNPDAHMSAGMTCSDCHYALNGDFAAYEHDVDGDGSLEVIQLAQTGITSIDHQFAKGNNRPDGKNMDQLDNTITCEACHIPGTAYGNHPGFTDNGNGTATIVAASGTYIAPIPTHAAFPAFHIEAVDCRTCHIPEMNFLKKQMNADYSTTPYPLDYNATTMNMGGIGRSQNIVKKIGGVPQRIHYKPIYAWRDRTHGEGDMKLTPIVLGSAAVWKDLANGLPYAQRFAGKASKVYRNQVGDADLDGYADFSLNNPQGGDTALIANTTTEIAGMVGVIQSLGKQSMEEPALNIFINTFSASHNVQSATAALGSAATGVCDACHSVDTPVFNSAPIDTNQDSPCYNQPEGCKGLVFFQPKDGGIGLEMTCDGGDCANGTARVTGGAVFPCRDGSIIAINLTDGVAHGQGINNVIPQEDILCYDPSYLAVLRQPQTSSYLDNLDAVLQWQHSATVSNEITFHGENSKCPSASCTYTWDYGDTNAGTGVTTTHTYAAPGQYDATLTVTDDQTGYYDTGTKTVTAQEISANPDPTVTVVAVGGLDAQLTITKGENNLSRLRVVWGDGSTSYPAAANPDTVVTHTYGASGTHNLTINIMDTAGNRYTETPSVVIP